MASATILRWNCDQIFKIIPYSRKKYLPLITVYPCTECKEEVYIRREYFVHHTKEYHPDLEKCVLCEMNFTSAFQLKNHQDAVHFNKRTNRYE